MTRKNTKKNKKMISKFINEYQTLLVGIATIPLALLSIILLWRDLNLTNQNLQSTFRPVLIPNYVGEINISDLVRKVPFSSTGNDHLGIQFNLKNVGKGPALNISVKPLKTSDGRTISYTATNTISLALDVGKEEEIGFAHNVEISYEDISNIYFGGSGTSVFHVYYEDLSENSFEFLINTNKGISKDIAISY
tara:strand:- start:3496 stop:4074 length:579 start_codon:yes stop_codon:yes gene_type:complete